MKKIIIIHVILCWFGSGLTQGNFTLKTLDTYATENSIGLEIIFNEEISSSTIMKVFYKMKNEPTWHAGHPMIRIESSLFTGSIFNAEPGTAYQIKILAVDSETGFAINEYPAEIITRGDELVNLRKAQDIYVSREGSDDNSGKSDAPFATIQKAVDSAGPGVVIHVQPGIYHQFTEIRTSGEPGSPIIIRGADEVIIDGSEPAFAEVNENDDWRAHETNGIYQATVDWEPGQVYVDGNLLFRYNNLNELQSLSVGEPGGWYYEREKVFIALTNQKNPDEFPVQVTRLPSAFHIENAAHIVIENFDMRYFGESTYGKVIYIKNASNCVIRNNKIHQSYCGVWIKGDRADENLVEGNEIWETSVPNWEWDYVKGSYHEGFGVLLEGAQGNVVRKNEFYGYFNGIAVASWDEMENKNKNRNTDVYDNYFHDILDDCVEPEGACVNLRIWNNIMYRCMVGISLAPITVGPVFAWRNIVADFFLTSFKFSSSTDGPCMVYHNTAYTNRPETNGIISSGSWSNITFRNNIISGTSYAFEDHHLTGEVNFDFDNLFTTDANRFVKWKGERYLSLDNFTENTNMEEHAISANSCFVDEQNHDFRLTASSPNIDKGLIIPNINENYSGNAPDIGAIEFIEENSSMLKVSPIQIGVKPLVIKNYPNPFNNVMMFQYHLPKATHAKLMVFNCQGQVVDVVFDGYQAAGDYSRRWSPNTLSSGVYWFKLQTEQQVTTGKCIFLK